jgi:hypothetical protein
LNVQPAAAEAVVDGTSSAAMVNDRNPIRKGRFEWRKLYSSAGRLDTAGRGLSRRHELQ